MKLNQSIFALIMAFGTLHAGAWNNAQDARLPQSSRRIVMMGNSITEYWLGHAENNHKEFFSDNGALCRGIAAQQTPAMLARFDSDVVSVHPLVTVIAGGVNDLNDKSTVDDVFNNNVEMARRALTNGIRPIMASITPSGWGKDRVDKYIEYNKRIKAYCDEQGLSFCNYFDAVTMGTILGEFSYTGDYNEMKYEYRGRADHGDHLHPGREGYLVMESVLIPLIEENIWHDGFYQAEHAVKQGSGLADVEIDGTTLVGGFAEGNSLKIGYTAPAAGCYYLTADYSAIDVGLITVTVGDESFTAECCATAGIGSMSMIVKLPRGFNSLVITADGVQLDRFSIKQQTLADIYPTFSILGDSYSTYKGWIDAGIDFGGGGYEYPQPKYDLESVDDTWWKIFEAASGSRLVQNNSISGTCMSYIDLNGSGTTKNVSFVNRVTKMRPASLFIIEGGTNDFIAGRTTYSNATDASINGKPIVGEYMWDGFQPDMPDYRFVRPAVAYLIWYLQTTYPDCTVVFMANDKITAAGRESFRTICEHYGAIYYEMHDIERSVENPHPLKAGMRSIAQQLLEVLNEHNGILPVSDKFYIYNVGAGQWVKAGASVGAERPLLAGLEERTALTITGSPAGYRIASDDNLALGWGVSGRNILYDNNDGLPTARWGTTYTPGWEFVDTGDGDGSVYIRYTWGNWKKGSVSGINDPGGCTYSLFYGDWALGTYRWAANDRKDIEQAMIYPDEYARTASHGDFAKWRLLPIGDGHVDVLPCDIETSAIDAVTADDDCAATPAEYYNLQGLRVLNPGHGLYIMRRGSRVKKVIL